MEGRKIKDRGRKKEREKKRNVKKKRRPAEETACRKYFGSFSEKTKHFSLFFSFSSISSSLSPVSALEILRNSSERKEKKNEGAGAVGRECVCKKKKCPRKEGGALPWENILAARERRVDGKQASAAPLFLFPECLAEHLKVVSTQRFSQQDAGAPAKVGSPRHPKTEGPSSFRRTVAMENGSFFIFPSF